MAVVECMTLVWREQGCHVQLLASRRIRPVAVVNGQSQSRGRDTPLARVKFPRGRLNATQMNTLVNARAIAACTYCQLPCWHWRIARNRTQRRCSIANRTRWRDRCKHAHPAEIRAVHLCRFYLVRSAVHHHGTMVAKGCCERRLRRGRFARSRCNQGRL